MRYNNYCWQADSIIWSTMVERPGEDWSLRDEQKSMKCCWMESSPTTERKLLCTSLISILDLSYLLNTWISITLSLNCKVSRSFPWRSLASLIGLGITSIILGANFFIAGGINSFWIYHKDWKWMKMTNTVYYCLLFDLQLRKLVEFLSPQQQCHQVNAIRT